MMDASIVLLGADVSGCSVKRRINCKNDQGSGPWSATDRCTVMTVSRDTVEWLHDLLLNILCVVWNCINRLSAVHPCTRGRSVRLPREHMQFP